MADTLFSELVKLLPWRLLMVQDSNNPEQAVPLSTAMFGGLGSGTDNQGGSNSGSPDAVTNVYPAQRLTVGAGVEYLAPAAALPAGARASVHVVSGSIRWGLGSPPGPTTPVLLTGDSAELSGGEIGEWQMTRDGDTNAQVYVVYEGVG